MTILEMPPLAHTAFNPVILKLGQEEGETSAKIIVMHEYAIVHLEHEFFNGVATFDLSSILKTGFFDELVEQNPELNTGDYKVYSNTAQFVYYQVVNEDFSQFKDENDNVVLNLQCAINSIAQFGESSSQWYKNYLILNRLDVLKLYPNYPLHLSAICPGDTTQLGLINNQCNNLLRNSKKPPTGVSSGNIIINDDGTWVAIDCEDTCYWTQNTQFRAGAIYTISVKCKREDGSSDDGGSIQVAFDNINNYEFIPNSDNIDYDYKIYKLTRTLSFTPAVSNSINFKFPLGRIQIEYIKIEENTIATAWTPTYLEMYLATKVLIDNLTTKVCNYEIKNYVDYNVNVVYAQHQGLEINEQRTVQNMPMPENPFYIRFINQLGGFEYWMFSYRQIYSRALINLQHHDWITTTELVSKFNTEVISIDGAEKVTVGSSGLSANEYDCLSKIIYSPRIELWDATLQIWKSLKIENGDSQRDTHETFNDIELTFILPQPQLQI